jgi:thiamine-phosphate diphosphorylase/hydroxyethylthiazole kinase
MIWVSLQSPLYPATDFPVGYLQARNIVFEAAKKLLPKDAIIGISTSTVEQAKKAIADGADYLGIGAMFATPT